MIPAQGLSVVAGVMAQTLKDLASRQDVVDFLKRAKGDGDASLLPFVAYLGGQPAATALLVVRGRTAQIFGGVHVVGAHRRKGIGGALLHAVLRYAATLDVTRVWVARDVADPPTPDDLAAMALYDRAGGVRKRPLVEIVYSPQCPWSRHWLDGFEREIAGLDAELRAYDLWEQPDRAWALLGAAGLCAEGARSRAGPGALKENVFTTVFVDGEAVGSIPLAPGTLRGVVGRVLGQGATIGKLGLAGPSGGGFQGPGPAAPPGGAAVPYPRVEPRASDYAAALAGLRIEPLTVPGSDALMDLCLVRHPSGFSADPQAAAAGADLKRRWLGSLGLPGGFFGVAARRGAGYAGIMEVYPRAVAAKAGFATGTWGDGEAVLTITCIEVAYGEPRHPVMEFLVEGLLAELGRHVASASGHDVAAQDQDPDPAFGRYRDVEAVGHYGNMAGFNPYWLFDKYGFVRREERVPGVSVILSRSLVKP